MFVVVTLQICFQISTSVTPIHVKMALHAMITWMDTTALAFRVSKETDVKPVCHVQYYEHFTAWPLTRYVKSRVAHAPGKPGTFSPLPTSKETASWQSRHAPRHVRDARAVRVRIANPRWRWKRSRHSRRMRNPQFYVSGKRPVEGVCNPESHSWGYCTAINILYLRQWWS